MPDTLIICEKPSQAKALKAALGTRYGDILAARGHILTLVEPQDVKPEWGQTWTTEILWPGKFYPKKPVAATMRDFLNPIKAAAKSAKTIIIATDCDREGMLIGGEIVDHIGFKGKVLRAIFNAEDKKSLQDAFAALRPASDFDGLYAAGQAREQADQISNLSLTRAATVALKKPGTKGAIGIGRVKSPVLGIVCKRELEILDFKPSDMFEIDATTKVASGTLVLTCARLPKSLIKEQAEAEGLSDDNEEEDLTGDAEALADKESMVGRILRKDIAEKLAATVKGHEGPITSQAAKRSMSPPKLYDLTALQSAASAKFNWTGSKTLEIAQKLYSDRTMITYPRGEARYVPENNIGDVPRIVDALLNVKKYEKHSDLLQSPKPRRGKSGHFCDAALEGMSHYAIIPNINTANQFAALVPNLSEDEAKLFDLIAKQYMAAMAPDHEYKQTTINMTVKLGVHDWDFKTSGRVPLVAGWKEILGGSGSDLSKDGPELPAVKNGETATMIDAKLRTVTTRPPARYTEGSLITVMQQAWRLVDDPVMRERLKEAKGIGTPATRDSVVTSLMDQQQLITKGKQIQPTEGGMALYKTLLAVCPNVVDPVRTAQWETMFDMVEKGKMSAQDAVLRIVKETTNEIARIESRSGEVSISVGKTSKPTDNMIKAAKMIAERKDIKLPKGLLGDSSVCSAFLKEHMGERKPGEGGGSFAPSEKQMAFAERIAEGTGKKIPDEARASSKDLSTWIDKNQKAMPARPPSEKQIAFAKKLAGERDIDLPDDVETDGKACSAFIDAQMNGKPAGSAGKKSGASYRKASSPSPHP
jgi:DNA topoisomerase-3